MKVSKRWAARLEQAAEVGTYALVAVAAVAAAAAAVVVVYLLASP